MYDKMNKLTQELTRQFNVHMFDFLIGRRHMKREITELFNSLLMKIHRTEVAICGYVKRDISQRADKYRISIENENIELSFSINKNLTSVLEFRFIETKKCLFQDNFIERHVDLQRDKYVYFLKSDFGFKIGKTKDLSKRKNIFDVRLPFKTEVYAYILTKKMNECELFFHDILKERRINGEWFDLTEKDFITIQALSREWGKFIKYTPKKEHEQL